ncbi:PH domain-containing protein [Herbiconiux sp. 11R-BC]|uniref:PH domain-containing protein n=1 Tax=Herbiconiux sp. 11R-BC TaxID=3111637 RepID=UPI003C10C89E
MSAPDDGAPPPQSRLSIGGDWHRVSPKLLGVEIASGVVGTLVLCAITVPFILLGTWFGWPALGLAVLIGVVTLALAPRRVRAIGYQLRADDLVFRRGIMFHRVVSVPYGRMQLIDINRGPVARALGLAELKFVTAAASTGVSIPGLVEAEANALRDELVALAESRRVGL